MTWYVTICDEGPDETPTSATGGTAQVATSGTYRPSLSPFPARSRRRRSDDDDDDAPEKRDAARARRARGRKLEQRTEPHLQQSTLYETRVCPRQEWGCCEGGSAS